ncbi:hypothetical protein [Colwellia sp. PAMC 21821]|uniref:hypothetical protein n=1 Tax=Colwellia sp. PAMC 21821 TaxID=1816219 RepID=UPI0012DD3650|nr:hypothetical protein [Colwellia sp. PAMC 21821]
MIPQEQQIISQVIEWAGSIDAAKKWYEREQIPALDSTAKSRLIMGIIRRYWIT